MAPQLSTLTHPSAGLLERDEPLRALAQALELASRRGRLVAISGEAGIGKSALLEEFARRHGSRADFIKGSCDALLTPSPLGPLADIAAEIGGETWACFRESRSRQQLFAAFVEDLSRRAGPTVVVVEDIHWADEATLDLLQYVGRRVDRTRALIAVTWRDDEVGLDHPIRRILGEWRHDATLRIELRPLSLAAVSELAGTSRDSRMLHALTGGNPFFVTEVLGTDEPPVPICVRDAVLARRASVPADARAVVDFVSIVPSRADFALVETALGPPVGAIEACMAAGLLKADAQGLTFRHELARLAVAGALPPTRARQFHRLVLDALRAHANRSAVLARIVHHADACGAIDAIVEHAPAAARQASTLGAHRQAVAHYALALQHAEQLTDETRADIFERYAYELYVTGDMPAARTAQREALERWERLNTPVAVGRCLRLLSRLAWFIGDRDDADHCANRAIEVLESLPASHELAMAYSNRSQLDMLVRDLNGCVEWGERGAVLATRNGWTDVLCHALNNVGTVCADAAQIEESLELALANALDEHAARAFTNLATTEINRREYEKARAWIDRGLAYTAERDIDALGTYLQAWRSRLRAETGLWEEACDDAHAVLTGGARRPPIPTRISALLPLGLVKVRRGDEDARDVVEEALSLSRRTRESQRLVPALTLCAEFALITGRDDDVQEYVREALCARPNKNELDWLAYLAWKAGAHVETIENHGPSAFAIRGEWRECARAWSRIGCPYEEALALLEGDLPAVTRALEMFQTLDAAPGVLRAQQRLRELGGARVPRGRRASTRAHPAGLTSRESEILAMLARGLPNPVIAQRLFVSRKTIEHHVSSILGKLGVPCREAAVTHARRQGWLPATAQRE